MGNLHVSGLAAGDQEKYSRVPTKVLVMGCNWILFLGTALDIYGIWQASRGWRGWISEHESAQSHANPASKYVCMIPVKWKGRHRLGLLTDGWAAPWGGRRYGFEPRQTAEEIDTLPQFNNTLERTLKSAYWECLSCRTDALHAATCSLTPWLSEQNPSGLTVNLRLSLRGPLQGDRAEDLPPTRSLNTATRVWVPAGTGERCLAERMQLKCLNYDTWGVLLCCTLMFSILRICIVRWFIDRSDTIFFNLVYAQLMSRCLHAQSMKVLLLLQYISVTES